MPVAHPDSEVTRGGGCGLTKLRNTLLVVSWPADSDTGSGWPM